MCQGHLPSSHFAGRFAICTMDDMKAKKQKKNPAAVQLGRLGGKQTAKQFTKERGKELAEKRWGKKKKGTHGS